MLSPATENKMQVEFYKKVPALDALKSMPCAELWAVDVWFREELKKRFWVATCESWFEWQVSGKVPAYAYCVLPSRNVPVKMYLDFDRKNVFPVMSEAVAAEMLVELIELTRAHAVKEFPCLPPVFEADHACSADTLSLRMVAQNLVMDGQSSCLAYAQSLQAFLTSASAGWAGVVDLGVYDTHRHLRYTGNTKLGENRPFVRLDIIDMDNVQVKFPPFEWAFSELCPNMGEMVKMMPHVVPDGAIPMPYPSQAVDTVPRQVYTGSGTTVKPVLRGTVGRARGIDAHVRGLVAKIPSKYADDRYSWRRIMACLVAEAGDDAKQKEQGRQLFHIFSQKSIKYDRVACDVEWYACDRQKAAALGRGTLVNYAKPERLLLAVPLP